MSNPRKASEILVELAEDFVLKIRRGERPTAREYVVRHPELADEIERFIAALGDAEDPLHGEDGAPTAEAESNAEVCLPRQRIGDFRIIRQVGRGGMGIVYEAEQMSLNRHVAVKVLPRQVMLDDRQKRRFEREARSAA